MPVTPTYPGIYIQEAPSSAHTITPAPTNVAVFIGYTHPLKTNPANFGVPVEIFGFLDYQRHFGGFVRSAAFASAANAFGDMAVAVNQFFLNGGSDAFIVALTNSNLPAAGATVSFGGLTFTAREITDETYQMTVTIRPIAAPVSPPNDELADVIITYGPTSGAGAITETYRRVSMNPVQDDGVTPNPNFIETMIGTADRPVSSLVTVSAGSPPALFPTSVQSQTFPTSLSVASASQIFEAADFTAVLQPDTALDKLPVFNLMVIPGVSDGLVLSTALAFCERKLAFFIMDPPIADSADGTTPGFPHRIQDTANDPGLPRSKNGALYFPYLLSPDPITGAANNAVSGAPNEIPPAATVAGIFAATDVARGVWKAPAGFQATTNNTTGVVARGRMTDPRQGVLNPLGVNCLRDFPNIGTAVFGARTLVTATDEQWRYVPVRRMALFLEQTLYANLKWVVFEPNAEPLWSAITMSINAFMLGLFKQNAFQGEKPSEAFQVLCNSQTTTQADIDNGIVNIVVAFAPLKPAEFVIITIAQMAGQTQTA
jgi:phage tail sheath protein FI